MLHYSLVMHHSFSPINSLFFQVQDPSTYIFETEWKKHTHLLFTAPETLVENANALRERPNDSAASIPTYHLPTQKSVGFRSKCNKFWVLCNQSAGDVK